MASFAAHPQYCRLLKGILDDAIEDMARHGSSDVRLYLEKIEQAARGMKMAVLNWAVGVDAGAIKEENAMGSNQRCPDCGDTVAVIEAKFVAHDDPMTRKTCRRSNKGGLFKTFFLGSVGPSRDGDIDEINLSVTDDPDSEGCLYEFGIHLVQFREGHFALSLRVFSDAWEMFADCPEIPKLLLEFSSRYPKTSPTPTTFDEIVKRLTATGWKNEGRKTGRYYRHCAECSQEIKVRT